MEETAREYESAGRAAQFNARVLGMALAARLERYPAVPTKIRAHEVLAIAGYECARGKEQNALRIDVCIGQLNSSARRYSILYEYAGRITLLDRFGSSREYQSIENDLCIAEVLRRLARNHNLH